MRINFTSSFRKDLKLIARRGYKINELEYVTNLLCNSESLPHKYKDHRLENSRNFYGARECHIRPDWLFVYRIDKAQGVVLCLRTGTHSDLFGK